MFTGIITAIGRITKISPLGADTSLQEPSSHGLCLTIETPKDYLNDVILGDSIAINGACMTVTRLHSTMQCFEVDVSRESLNTTCGLDRTIAVNLEKALRANDRLGGHLVSGHVDGIGHITHFAPVGESWLLTILAPPALARFLAAKGSVTVNGVSLTINTIQDQATGCLVHINLIPHTIHNTALATLTVDDTVNLEIDLIARYVERMLSTTQGD